MWVVRQEQTVSLAMMESHRVRTQALFVSTCQALEIVQPAHINLHLWSHSVVRHRAQPEIQPASNHAPLPLHESSDQTEAQPEITGSFPSVLRW